MKRVLLVFLLLAASSSTPAEMHCEDKGVVTEGTRKN